MVSISAILILSKKNGGVQMYITDRMHCIQGGITEVAGEFDAIVNAANNTLLGGGGVDGAIHKAAGPELLSECLTLNGCADGQAKITRAYNLPCEAIIHTVGPDFRKFPKTAPVLLYVAYISALDLAKQKSYKAVAFPSISTGIFAFPIQEAAYIAIQAVKGFLKKNTDMEVTWVLYTGEDYRIYLKTLECEAFMENNRVITGINEKYL